MFCSVGQTPQKRTDWVKTGPVLQVFFGTQHMCVWWTKGAFYRVVLPVSHFVMKMLSGQFGQQFVSLHTFATAKDYMSPIPLFGSIRACLCRTQEKTR